MQRRLRCTSVGITVLATGLAGAGGVMAQGSNVMQHGACATARVSAGVAKPCDDGSAILFNPAGLVGHGGRAMFGVTGINTSANFTFDITAERFERDGSTSLVPTGFASYRIDEDWAVGFGFFAPYGLGIDWPLDFEGRFVTYDTSLRNIYLQPTVAYRINDKVSVGGGIDFVIASIELNQRQDLAEQTVPGTNFTFGQFGIPFGTDFADANLEGDATGIGVNIGVIYEINDEFSVGARYLHSVDLGYDGDADFTQINTGLVLGPGNPLGLPGGTPLDAVLAPQFAPGGALANGPISTDLDLPYHWVIGAAYAPREDLRLFGDYQYTGWESFDIATITFEQPASSSEPVRTSDLVLDYENTHTFMLAGEYDATDDLMVRAGFRYNTPAEKDASVSPFLPEAERNYYTLGLGYDVGYGVRLDVGYQAIIQADRRGRVRGRTFGQDADDVNVGVYSVDAHAFSISAVYKFGGDR